jgi:tetratricopeptide (TPR) repeat protein
MKTIDFSYFIERYNAGEMSETEKQWFEKELEGNEKLRTEVELRKKTDDILRQKNVMSLRSKLVEIERKRNETVAPVKVSGKSAYIKYAAVIAALMLIGSLVFIPGKNQNTDELVRQYYKAYEPPTNQRSAQTSTDADFSLALEFYNTHDYDKAATLFSKVLESKPNDMQTVLLKGVSNFEQKQYPEAKQSFGKVIDDNDNLYVDQARWYLALCYLNTGEKDKAIQLFSLIGKENGIYQKDARRILRKLK